MGKSMLRSIKDFFRFRIFRSKHQWQCETKTSSKYDPYQNGIEPKRQTQAYRQPPVQSINDIRPDHASDRVYELQGARATGQDSQHSRLVRNSEQQRRDEERRKERERLAQNAAQEAARLESAQRRERERCQRISEEKRAQEAAHIEQARLESERRAREAIQRRIAERNQNASVERVRYLRGLIREKYQLDISIWEEREIQEADRPDMYPDCRRADILLEEINQIVNGWGEDQFGKEEWMIVEKIKNGLNKSPDQHLLWCDLPPWDERRLNRGYLDMPRRA